MGEVAFIHAGKADRGGLKVAIKIQSKERFMEWVDEWNERNAGRHIGFYGYPKIRYAYIDGSYSELFKFMSINEFEAIFNEEDRKRLGRLLEYRKGDYPIFLKEIYVKHGILQGGELDE
jgi:hypothetical protein